MGIRPQQQPIPNSQIAQNVLEQTEMIHQDLRKHIMPNIDDEPPTTSHWSAHNESCQLANLKKKISVFQITIVKLHHIGHDTYFIQILTSTETSLRTAERQEISYVRAAPRRRPLQPSLLLNEGLVFRPASLDLTALDPSAL